MTYHPSAEINKHLFIFDLVLIRFRHRVLKIIEYICVSECSVELSVCLYRNDQLS